MSRRFRLAPLWHGENLEKTDKTEDDDEEKNGGINKLELSQEEKALLRTLIDKGVKKIFSRANIDGVTYDGIDEIMTNYKPQRLRQLLESIANKGFLEVKEHDPYIFCPKCDSVHVYSKFSCPKCQSIQVSYIELIEHQFCGYTGEKKEFINGNSLVCPKCGTTLGPIDGKPLGNGSRKDFRIIGSSFECEKCGNRFNKPDVAHVCQKCGETFNYRNAVYNHLKDYEISDDVLKNVHVRAGYNILLIEDNPDDAEIITRYFKKSDEQFEVDHALNGSEGLDEISKKYYDIILLDYNLPSMNGLEVLEEIKNKEVKTPVIILTGADERETAVKLMKAGALDYKVKSLETYEELPSTIKSILEGKR